MSTRTQKKKILFENLLGVRFTSGNKIDILRNGDEIFPAMLQAIKQSKKSIEFVTYVYWKGDIGTQFAKTLARKAKEGVAVRVIIDAFGGMSIDRKLIKEMKDSGVEFVWFRPLLTWKFWHWSNRNHEKILVCDNKIAFTGGVGIADPWKGDARNSEEWREDHFRIQGPAVSGLRAAFFKDWLESGNQIDFAFEEITEQKPKGNSLVQVICSDSSLGFGPIALTFHTLINAAKKTITIVTPYFNPSINIVKELCRASEKGIKVNVLVPGKHVDHKISRTLARTNYRDMIESGINVYEYEKTMFHAKAVLVDEEVSCLGSINFNHRSMIKDKEIALMVLDKEINKKLNAHTQEDLVYCRKIDHEVLNNRPLKDKILEKILYIIQREL